MDNQTYRLPLARSLFATAAIALSLASIGARAADPMTSATGGNVPGADRKFIEKAAIGGMTEVEMGKLAQEKGTSPQVKSFGAQMVTDHTKANSDLEKVASAKGVTVPGTLDKSHRGDVDKMAKKSGADFDKAYVKYMLSDHKSDVSDFQKEAKSGKDGDVQAFASQTLPTLQKHLDMIADIDKNMK